MGQGLAGRQEPAGFAGTLGAGRPVTGPTIVGLFRAAVAFGGTRTALMQGGRSLSFSELDRRTDALAAHLESLGIGHGDRVAILSENRIEYVEAVLATLKLGAIACCQNWRQSSVEMAHCLSWVTPKLMFASPRFEDQAKSLGPWPEGAQVIFGSHYEALIATSVGASFGGGPRDPEDGAIILYTSGTTGLPKAAVISHRAEIARAALMGTDQPVERDAVFVAWAPLFHMLSTDSVLANLMRGGASAIVDGFDAAELARLSVEHVLGFFPLIPGTIEPFLSAVEATGKPVRRIYWAGVMPDLVPRREIDALGAATGAPYLNTFGSTETGPAPASADAIRPGDPRATFSKRQSSFCQLRLVDEDGNDVPDGTPGEALLRSATLFSGYWNDPASSAAAFEGGWFHMGDVLRRNPDGTLDFVDRRKYLIKSGGENIYPAEIERVLLSHPNVADAAVVRKPDPKWGEIPVAFVVPHGATPDPEELRVHCATQIARYKLPREFVFVEESALSRSATGKIQRQQLEASLLR